MNHKQYFKQWLNTKKSKNPSNRYAEVLELFPTNAFQLNFWCDLMFLIKFQNKDIPQQAIFYLHDKSYEALLSTLTDNTKSAFSYKIQLLQLTLGMSVNVGFSSLRQGIQQCMAIAHTNEQNNQIRRLHENIEIKSLCEHFCNKTTFTLAFICQQIARFQIRQNGLKINQTKKLHEYDDISMINIFINHLSIQEKINKYDVKQRQSEIIPQLIKEFLVKHKKSKIVGAMKDHILREAMPDSIQFLMELAYKLDIINDIFDYKSVVTKYSLRTKQTEAEIFQKMFSDELSGNNFKYAHYFEKYMIKNMGSQPLALYKTLKIYSTIHYNTMGIQQLLKTKDINIFYAIQESPLKTSQACLEYYLRKSNFQNPYTKKLYSVKSTNEKHIPSLYNCKEITDPFLFLVIHKDFWNHPYHKEVLNIILWMTLQHWCLYVENCSRHKDEPNSAGIEEYKKTLGLTMFQFMIGYDIGSFVQYYPIQKGLVVDIAYLPNFSELIIQNGNLYGINWFNSIINYEYQILMKQKRGLELIRLYLKKKKNTIENGLGEYLLSVIENQLKKSQEKGKGLQFRELIQILKELEDSWKFKAISCQLRQKYMKNRDN